MNFCIALPWTWDTVTVAMLLSLVGLVSLISAIFALGKRATRFLSVRADRSTLNTKPPGGAYVCGICSVTICLWGSSVSPEWLVTMVYEKRTPIARQWVRVRWRAGPFGHTHDTMPELPLPLQNALGKD